jgi:hypothetical protein
MIMIDGSNNGGNSGIMGIDFVCQTHITIFGGRGIPPAGKYRATMVSLPVFVPA